MSRIPFQLVRSQCLKLLVYDLYVPSWLRKAFSCQMYSSSRFHYPIEYLGYWDMPYHYEVHRLVRIPTDGTALIFEINFLQGCATSYIKETYTTVHCDWSYHVGLAWIEFDFSYSIDSPFKRLKRTWSLIGPELDHRASSGKAIITVWMIYPSQCMLAYESCSSLVILKDPLSMTNRWLLVN